MGNGVGIRICRKLLAAAEGLLGRGGMQERTGANNGISSGLCHKRRIVLQVTSFPGLQFSYLSNGRQSPYL